MNEREALKLALEALQWNWGGEPLPTLELQAINAIKEVLAQPEQESDDLTADDLTAAYLSGLYDGKNKYAPQPEQEPHGWYIDGYGAVIGTEEPKSVRVGEWLPWYTTPPQRTWIGLTEEERDHFEGLHLYAARGKVDVWIEGVPAFIQAIEAKLREKNGE